MSIAVLVILLGVALVFVAIVTVGVLVGISAAHKRSAAPDRQHPGSPDATADLGPLSQAVDQISHGIVIMDGSGQVSYRNRVARQFSVARFNRTLVEDCVQRLLNQARSGASCSETLELFGPPLESFFVSAYPFSDANGPGAMALVENHSEIRRTETVRRDFVANISHELKTPIGALGLLAETIEGEGDPEVMRRLAARMITESDRAARTIDDLLDLSRIEFGDDVDFSVVVLADVVAEATARISNAAEQAGITISAEVVDDLLVTGDSRQLVSALFNLLENAVKYSPATDELNSKVEVRVGLAGSGDTVKVSVADHGIGIPRASLERVFERFYRVDRARARNTGGTGLGLAIVRHVVSNHGGEMMVESREGSGSVFTMLLPVANSEPHSGGAPPTRPARTGSQ